MLSRIDLHFAPKTSTSTRWGSGGEMKKTVLKKLTVKKEMLRTLTPAELTEVAGGTSAESESPGSFDTQDCV